MGSLSIEDRGDGVRLLVLDAEARRNALDPAMLEALERACTEAHSMRCLVLTGRGDRAFSAGYDLDALATWTENDPLPDALVQRAASAIEAAGPPVVAAVAGAAYGAGAELAAACDLRIGGPGARISLPPAKLGIIYAPKGLRRFVDLLGPARTRHLVYTGEVLDADQALRAGFFEELAENALARALEMATRIAANAPLAVQGMKRILRGDLPADQIEDMRRASFASNDAREALAAIKEKRPPVFRGR